MRNFKLSLVTIAGLILVIQAGWAATAEDEPTIAGLKGPARAHLGNVAQVDVPANYQFLDGKRTREIMKAMGEPTSGHELGWILPTTTNEHCSVIFEFNDAGYVKDDDKDKLDPEKLLKAIIKGNDYGNEERKKTGVPPLNIIGWEQKPAYDSATHNLEWAIRAESGDRPIINYNTRLLGRKGVMEVILIVKPDALADTLPTFKELLKDYSFKSGESYAEFRQGDKLAKYGLAALITGGAVAVAAKTGLLTAILLIFKKAWKLVVIGAVAVVSFFKRLILGKGRTSPTP